MQTLSLEELKHLEVEHLQPFINNLHIFDQFIDMVVVTHGLIEQQEQGGESPLEQGHSYEELLERAKTDEHFNEKWAEQCYAYLMILLDIEVQDALSAQQKSIIAIDVLYSMIGFIGEKMQSIEEIAQDANREYLDFGTHIFFTYELMTQATLLNVELLKSMTNAGKEEIERGDIPSSFDQLRDETAAKDEELMRMIDRNTPQSSKGDETGDDSGSEIE